MIDPASRSPTSNYFILRYTFPDSHSSLVSIKTALTNLSKEASLGNNVATLVLRLISLFSRSSILEVRIFFQCDGGKVKTVSPSGRFSSIHSDKSGAVFIPDPHQDSPGGSRQYACSAPSCQSARHRDAHQRWLKRNPDAYQGRYVKVKLWRSHHSDYPKQYRREHPKVALRDNEKRKCRHQRRKNLRAMIQDALSHQPSIEKAVKDTLFAEQCAVIQDALWRQSLVISLVSCSYFARGRAVIQDPFASDISPGYLPLHDRETTTYSRPDP